MPKTVREVAKRLYDLGAGHAQPHPTGDQTWDHAVLSFPNLQAARKGKEILEAHLRKAGLPGRVSQAITLYGGNVAPDVEFYKRMSTGKRRPEEERLAKTLKQKYKAGAIRLQNHAFGLTVELPSEKAPAAFQEVKRFKRKKWIAIRVQHFDKKGKPSIVTVKYPLGADPQHAVSLVPSKQSLGRIKNIWAEVFAIDQRKIMHDVEESLRRKK